MDEKLKNIFSKVFNIPVELVNDDLKEGSIDSWDSLGHLTLFMELEKEFGIKFSLNEIQSNIDFLSIKKLIISKMVENEN